MPRAGSAPLTPLPPALGFAPTQRAFPTPAPNAPLPSDFPAALGFLEEGDLPVVSPDLPAAKRTAGSGAAIPPAPGVPSLRPRGLAVPPASRPTEPHFSVPAPASALESRIDARLAHDSDLPEAAVQLPAVVTPASRAAANAAKNAAALQSIEVGLPVVSASLPASVDNAAYLPSPSSPLPVTAQVLPQLAQGKTGRPFGEIDLPVAADSLPVIMARERHLPSPVLDPDPGLGGAFGEIDLPREAPASAREAALVDRLSFSQGDASPPSTPPSSENPAPRAEAPGDEAGMSFGEVDLGGDGEAAALRVESPGAAAAAARDGGPLAARWPVAPRVAPGKRKPKTGRIVALLLTAVAFLAGASVQLTPYGAFGYLAVSDVIHAGAYAQATDAAIAGAEKSLGADTYDAAKAAVESAYAAHAQNPRAKPLTAYAALVDAETTVRFGPDATRASRAKQLVADVAPGGNKVAFLDAAVAVQTAAAGDLEKARALLQAQSQSQTPVTVDVLRALGDVELALSDAPEALSVWKRASAIANDASAHFGLARAYDLAGDAAGAKREIEATLAATPTHPGALTLRARRKSAASNPTQALADLAVVLDGPARATASPMELSDAYAARAWVDLERGATGDARDAFAQAVKLNPANVDALNGEGRLFLDEGRYAEALARFDTALKNAPLSPETIASDAAAKLALERLADAKQQLTAARDRFPKSVPILLTLGKVEQRLGNLDAAEGDLRTAIASVDPARPDGVLPYVALSELLSARGHLGDAKALLDDASKRLAPSAALDRAFGEVSELSGDYDGAIARYQTAVARAPTDLASHFRLAVALRRVHKFDQAAAELDRVAKVDKDYPGLLLERGLLFEESGDVAKAIDQFKEALARAPDDPDLELRVGSAYVAIDRPDDAVPMLHKVLDARPTSAEAHHFMGRALLEQGGSQADALHYLKRAVEIDPNRAEFHVYLARAANDATPAQLELARDEVDHALALDKENADAYWQRGVIERVEGAIDDAMKDERHALDLRPSRYEAHATLAECYEDKNQDAAALGEWARAIAGDGTTVRPDGTVPHSYWRYRYGKLLFEKGGRPASLAQLLPAVTAAEKMEIRPAWLAPLEYLTAEALRGAGRKADAVDHYRRFLEIAPPNSPDRADAKKVLETLVPHSQE
jgi:tetratricopeptide (TPR) repeat protein